VFLILEPECFVLGVQRQIDNKPRCEGEKPPDIGVSVSFEGSVWAEVVSAGELLGFGRQR
jgi:hypothetical protein